MGINRVRVTILVDSGSIYNFMSDKLAIKMNLKPDVERGFKVEMANGDFVQGKGLCSGMEMVLQGVKMKADFFILPIPKLGVVLGTHWLQTLGLI